MTAFAVNPETLKNTLLAVLGDKAKRVDVALGEVCVVVDAADYLDVAMQLRDAPGCQFEQLIDLCGIDYSEYKEGAVRRVALLCGVAIVVSYFESTCSFESICQRRWHANRCLVVRGLEFCQLV